MALKMAARNTSLKLMKRSRFFASNGRLFHSIDALYLKLGFEKLVFDFGSARSVSSFRNL
jgi:hypothetical protein